MKTAEYVLSEIDKIKNEYSEQHKFEEKELNKARKELLFLSRCYKYLTSECDKESYLKRELKTLEKRLVFIDDNYGKWCSSNPDIRDKYDNPLPVYRREMKRSKVIKQIETLKFLIK